MRIEYEAFKLAKAFLFYYKKHSFKTFKLSTVKESKWWPYFVSVAIHFSQESDWNADYFIAAQFEEKGKILPYQLVDKDAYETYKLYRGRYEADSEKRVVMNLLTTYKEVKEWKSIRAFLEDKKNQLLIERKSINPLLFFLCKSFYELGLNEMFDKEEIENKRAVVFSNKKVLKKMKEVLGDEFFQRNI